MNLEKDLSAPVVPSQPYEIQMRLRNIQSDYEVVATTNVHGTLCALIEHATEVADNPVYALYYELLNGHG